MPVDSVRAAQGVRHLRRVDPVLGAVIARVGAFRLKLVPRRFQALARSIISQQISGHAARTIWRRLEAAVAPRAISAESLAGVSEASLRGAGVSPQKLRYLQDLTRRVQQRELRLERLSRMPDDDVIEQLTQVKGIGVWTAQMFLIFSLGRLDVFPPDDLGIRTALQRLYGLPDLPRREESQVLAAPWRPYASIASWYLWRSLEGPKNA